MSGVIYAVIVVLWAAFLVPMWLRRHQEAAEAASADQEPRTIRILPRRSDRTTAGGDVADVRPAAPMSMIILGAGDPVAVRRRSAMIARRRRALATLVFLAVFSVVVAALGVLPWWAAGVSECLVVAYIVELRLHARRERDLARQRVRPGDRPLARRVDDAVDDPRVPVAVVDSSAATGEAETSDAGASYAAADDVDGAGWRPVAVPVPTYVTAPRASRAIRRIDLGGGGAWTSGRLVADAAAAGRAAAADAHREAVAEDLAAQRAVGN